MKNEYIPFVWNEEMSTGVEVIDAQHRSLLHMVNDAYSTLSENTNSITLQRITKELLSYAIYHFQTEESLMKQYGYAEERPEEADAHIKEHRNFSAKVVSAREALRSGDQREIIQMLEFLKSWITNHTQAIDKKLGRFIQEKEMMHH